jgi:hypothetical protein
VLTEKRCSCCGEVKPVGDFSRQNRSKDGLQAWCKACKTRATAGYKRRDSYSVVHRASRYGLTKDEVRLFMEIPACQSCGAPLEDSHSQKFDHCHDGGHFRGVLCHPCNMACQGKSQEATVRLAKCIDYLTRDLERVSE